MLTNIISFSIKNKLIIGILTISLIIFGIFEVKNLPIDAVPDITNNQVQIITVAPALGSTDIERLITFPIEQVSANISGLKELRSFSRFGLSVVTIVFEDDIDIYWARQQINERLQQVQDQLPKGLGSPTLAPVTTGLGEIYQYTVRAKEGYEDKFSPMELRTIQDWSVRRQLLSVKGVAEVSSFGGLQKQYEISIDPTKLMANGISISHVFSAIEKNNQNIGGSYIEKGPTVLYIRSEGLIGSIDDIKNIVIKNLDNGTPLLIRNVADVKIGNAIRYGAMTYNGTQQVSGAVVMMLKGANSSEVIASVKDRIQQIQKTLPEGVIIDPFLDRTKMVDNAIGTVTKNLIEGALIVIFVLVLFLGNMRAGILVASVIPLSMLFAIIMMNLFGVSGNLMSLGALDFGLIVDGAVIIVEAVMHKLVINAQKNKTTILSQADMDKEVSSSASKMMNSAVFGQIIILIVYLPIFTLQGIEGKMFKPMAQTVAFALIGAFILSLTYIPMMSSFFLSKKTSLTPSLSDKIMMSLEQFYQHVLILAFRRQKLIFISITLLFISSVALLTQLGGEFIPSLPEGDYAVETRVLTGSNINTSIEAVSKGAQILLQKFPEVEKIVSKTGSSEIPTDPLPIDMSDMIIVLKKRDQWTSASTYPELEAKMTKALQDVPGVSFGFQYPVAMRFNELISGARQDVVCKIFGENLDSLALYASKLGSICNTVKGSTGLYIETVTGMPQIVITYNRSLIAQYGLNINDVNKIVNAAFAGEVGGVVYEGEKRFDLVVRMAGNKRQDIAELQNLLIPINQGTQIPLQAIAEIKIIDGPNQIQRENSQRRITVGFNVRDRDLQSMVHELKQKVEKQMHLPTGYYITYGGAFENLEQATSRLYVAVPISLALIFLLLYLAFKSVKQGLLIYSAIPLSAIGGILALAVRGIPFSISAGIGFIALFGVAVLNGIVLIAEFNRLKDLGETNILRIVITGTKSRLRPVLMTAFVASLGFFPMAFSSGEGAEVQRPLATVVIGGLLIATFLTLFVLPILYSMLYKSLRIKKTPLIITVLFACIYLGEIHQTFGQTPITLQEAIDVALKNNLLHQNEKLRVLYNQKLIQSSTNIPATSISSERGQINSYYLDSKLSLFQSVSFPKVYQAQKKLLKENWESSKIHSSIREIELKKNVSEVFYNLIYLRQKQILLLQNDSIYSEFLHKSTLRFEKGESNILEKTVAENQREQIRLQLSILKQDLEIEQLNFKLLLNSEENYFPNERNLASNKSYQSINDSSLIISHPSVSFYSEQKKIARAVTDIERSKLLPNVFMGYNVMGMRGIGADNNSYNGNLQFHSVQFGLDIPILIGWQKARIDAAKTNELIANNEYLFQLKIIEKNYIQARINIEKCDKSIEYFEKTALINAKKIRESANIQLLNGNINYIEWTLLINQSISIESDYIEAIKNKNYAIIELQYFINK